MKRREKHLIASVLVGSLALCAAPSASAMHIMEGYLPPSYCVLWGVL